MIVLKKNRLFILIPITLAIIVALICFGVINKKNTSDSNSLYPKNSKGQTYGTAIDCSSNDDLPDLIYSVGKHGTKGYIVKSDFLHENKDKYETYTLAVFGEGLNAVRKTMQSKYDNADELDFYRVCYDVPMYDVNGDPINDSFSFTIGIFPYQSQLKN